MVVGSTSASSMRETVDHRDTRRNGLGYETVGVLLCAAGGNPERLNTEASFAVLCGTSPVASNIAA